MTVDGTLRAASARLLKFSGLPALDAARIFEYVSGFDRAWVLANPESQVPSLMAAAFDELVEARALGVPVAYLTRSAGFYGRTFEVTPDVLIPRSETELLVERGIAFVREMPHEDKDGARVLDVGTGSGAIAITLACELAEANVWATDIWAPALKIAQRNALRHDVASRITFVEANMFPDRPTKGLVPDPAAPITCGVTFQCIVANLPYIATGQIPRYGSVSFEPNIAVDGGRDGLEGYRRFLSGAPQFLERPGLLLMEAGHGNAVELASLASNAFGQPAEVVRDYAGLRRIVEVRLASDPMDEGVPQRAGRA